ncbi:hypothetical protein LR48_Vigan11g004700 [Vigna angularis]|uniref:Uncharacterized protein n=1 Tax=Phaseolus angularis TaxID=3914 RepID=A0A0L9VPP6_PHAAN|nr:hypothetical protein LR48_Vigan11g004700 [Vigna angularis]
MSLSTRHNNELPTAGDIMMVVNDTGGVACTCTTNVPCVAVIRCLGMWKKKEQEGNLNGGEAELAKMVLLLNAASMKVFVFPKMEGEKG